MGDNQHPAAEAAENQDEGAELAEASGALNDGETQDGAAAEQAPAKSASFEEIMANGTDEEIRELLRKLDTGEPLEESAADDPADGAQEGETEDEPEAAEPGEDEDDAEPDDEQEAPQRTAKAPKRIKPANADMVKLNDLVRAGKSLTEALRELGIKGDAAEAAETEKPKQEAQKPDPIAESNERLKVLQKELADANASFDFEKAAQLQADIIELVSETATLKYEKRVQQRAAQEQAEKQEAAVVQSIAEVVPDFTTKGTALNQAAEQIAGTMEKTNPAFFNDPNWPRKVFAMAWTEAHPDEPMPAIAKPAAKATAKTAPVAQKTVPKKPGLPAAMLRSGKAAVDRGEALAQKVFNGSATEAEIREYSRLVS